MDNLTRISDHFPTNSMGSSKEPLHTGVSVKALVSSVCMGHLLVCNYELKWCDLLDISMYALAMFLYFVCCQKP
jgi:hypothetical protein